MILLDDSIDLKNNSTNPPKKQFNSTLHHNDCEIVWMLSITLLVRISRLVTTLGGKGMMMRGKGMYVVGRGGRKDWDKNIDGCSLDPRYSSRR